MVLVALGVGLAVAWQATSRRRPPSGHPDRAALYEAEHIFDQEARAIRLLPVEEADIFAFRIRGRLTKPDVEAMARLLTVAFDVLEEVDILIFMEDLDGVDAGAVFDGPALSAQLRSNAHVRRYGVVAPPAWAGAMIDAFGPLIPVETRTFDAGEDREAWAWVRAGRWNGEETPGG
jgi:hypothetical protein